MSLLRALGPTIIGAFAFVGAAHAQDTIVSQSLPNIAKITVSVNGLTCGGSAAFAASTFQVPVSTPTSSGGVGGKTVFGNLLVQKSTDACSLPLFILASHDPVISQVVLNAADTTGKPIITITLQNAFLISSQLKAGAGPATAQESLDFFYRTMTIRDVLGVTTTIVH
jgi:hypothetical protein